MLAIVIVFSGQRKILQLLSTLPFGIFMFGYTKMSLTTMNVLYPSTFLLLLPHSPLTYIEKNLSISYIKLLIFFHSNVKLQGFIKFVSIPFQSNEEICTDLQ